MSIESGGVDKDQSDGPEASEELFDRILTLWDEGEHRKDIIEEDYKYWDGTNFTNPSDTFFLKEKRTPCNIIKQVVEAKLSDVQDAQFTASVVPQMYSFSDLQSIKDMQDVADVLNKGLQQVLCENNNDSINEQVGRWGFIKFGADQVVWDTSDSATGKIKVVVVDPRTLKWTKGQNTVDGLTWIAYSKDIAVDVAKKLYARNYDGSFDIDYCKKLDEAAGVKQAPDKNEGNKAVGAFQVNGGGDYTETAGMAYVKKSSKHGQGTVIPIVVMFLFDGTLQAPTKEDTEEELEEKEELVEQYPNGRVITFIPDKDKKLILEDKPAPKAFKCLGNITFFNTRDFDGFDNGGEVEDLVPIQERINGTIRKLRTKLGADITSILFDDKMRGVVDDSALVNLPVHFIEGLGDFQPPIMDNKAIEKAMLLRQTIEGLKQDAREQGRINVSFMTGENQDDVRSGIHADALNESAMGAIRPIQRNFKNYYISRCEKIVDLMVENYTPEKLIELGTGPGSKQYAMFNSYPNAQGQEQKTLQFVNEVGQIVREIKMDPDWSWKIDVSSGTEIPRSRRENAILVDTVLANPIMQNGSIEMIELYLKSKDFPNWREYVDIIKQQKATAAQQAQDPNVIFKGIMTNPQMLQALGTFIKDLQGYSAAAIATLGKVGLPGITDTVISAPIQSITTKSGVKDIAAIAPAQISQNQEQALFGNKIATNIIELEHKREAL